MGWTRGGEVPAGSPAATHSSTSPHLPPPLNAWSFSDSCPLVWLLPAPPVPCTTILFLLSLH